MNRMIAAAIALLITWAAAVPAATIYADRTAFESQLGTSITDDYEAAYPAVGFAIYSDASMTAFLGETGYESTHFSDLNIINSGAYCAGCNGSFRLTFTATSVTGASGVFGVGMDLPTQALTVASVTYGDNATEDFALPGSHSFWGITSPLEIKSIHFGLAGGVASNQLAVQIDNLTIGNAGSAIPEPGTWAMLGAGLGVLTLVRRRR